MPQDVIRVEGLAKQYRLGQIGTGTLRHDVNRLWHKVRGKEDPYSKVGDENDRTAKGNSEYVWALNDINFSVAKGQVVALVGRNGAGKSTLLKILSRTTPPTRGTARLKGRVASLLEVGTGFHGDLTGRENIFLNGTILGMKRVEIQQNFDAIVDFAGVERYIDTPVKRYSSGMYVRLAFAVAAHLEPDVLIVDEVLAVGDAEFQKKCLGRMKNASEQEGRTILFVSHNLQALTMTCTRGILLDNGRMRCDDSLAVCLKEYHKLRKQFSFDRYTSATNRLDRTNGDLQFTGLTAVKDDDDNALFAFSANEHVRLRVECTSNRIADGLTFFMAIKELSTENIITTMKSLVTGRTIGADERIAFTITIPPGHIRPGQYDLYCALADGDGRKWYDVIDANVGIPSLIITATTTDPHHNAGYVSIPFELQTHAEQ